MRGASFSGSLGQDGKYHLSGSHVNNLAGREAPIVRRYVGNAILRDAVFNRYVTGMR